MEIITTACQAPNMNAIALRWVLSVKSERITRMLLFGEESLRRALRESCPHFHCERPHQGLANDLVEPMCEFLCTGQTMETERLGGLRRSSHRTA